MAIKMAVSVYLRHQELPFEEATGWQAHTVRGFLSKGGEQI
jgi:hypothetical protein